MDSDSEHGDDPDKDDNKRVVQKVTPLKTALISNGSEWYYAYTTFFPIAVRVSHISIAKRLQ